MEHVNHPAHYNQAGRKECIVEMIDTFGVDAVINFCLCNEYKYLYRAGNKAGNSYDQDRRKAEWYREKAEMLKRGVY